MSGGAATEAPPGTWRPILRDRTLQATIGAVLVLVLVESLARPGGHTGQLVLGWTAAAALLALAAHSAHLIVGRSADPSSRRFWQVLTAAILLPTAGYLTQAGAVLLDPDAPGSGGIGVPIYAGQAIASVLGVIVLFTYPMGLRTLQQRVRFWLDAATVLAGSAAFCWYLALPSVTSGHTAGELTGLVATPVLVLLAGFGVVKVMLSTAPPFTRAAGTLLAAGATVSGIASAQPHLLSGEQEHWFIALQLLGLGVITIGLRLQYLQLRHGFLAAERQAKPYSLMPYAAIAATYTLLTVLLVRGEIDLRVMGVLIGAVLCTVLVSVRQVAAFAENAQLLGRLRTALDERDLISERLRVIVEHSSDLLLLTNSRREVRFANPAAEAAIGVPSSDLLGSDLLALIHPDDRAEALATPTGRATRVCRLRQAEDQWRHVEMSLGVVQEPDGSSSMVVNARDISERHDLEMQLRHAQKLESVGRLASGIAHEINTPVQFIGDNVRFLESAFGDLVQLRAAYGSALDAAAESTTAGSATAGSAALETVALETIVAEVRALEASLDVDFVVEEIPGALAQTLEGITRVATIVRAMKAFGYSGTEDKAPADLNEAIANTLVVSNSEVRDVADVDTHFGELPAVWCHVGDINQVVLNLVVNAAHAITASARGRGTIQVTTRVDGDDVVIEVTDSGDGIPAEIAGKVFEAFFTTKAVGTGTGQGLALCRSLVADRHRGTIDFTTSPGVGSTFSVRLPTRAGRDPAPAAPPNAARSELPATAQLGRR